MIARNWKGIAGTVLVAAVVHVASLLALPRLTMLRTMTAIRIHQHDYLSAATDRASARRGVSLPRSIVFNLRL